MGLRVVESKHGRKVRCGSKCDRIGEVQVEVRDALKRLERKIIEKSEKMESTEGQ